MPKIIPVLFLLFYNAFGLSAQNQRAEGYKGIWFTLGQFSAFGDKYSGGLGTYTSSHIPMAIYSKECGKTFFVYGGTTGKDEKHLLIMLSYYDHKKQGVPQPVIVYDKKDVNDPHDNPSLSIDKQGFIWVFISGRNTSRPGVIFKSSKPYSIEKMTEISGGEMTYPQPWFIKDKGFFYLFTKYTKGRELYWTKSKDGLNWGETQKLAGFGGHYQISNTLNGKTITAFNYHPEGNVDKRTNLYFLQTEDMGETWKNINREKVETPLSDKNNPALVRNYEDEKKLVYLNDINFDKQGNPIILAVISKHHQPGAQGDPRLWMVVHWKNGQWNYHTVSASTHNYDMGSLYVEGNTWRIIGPTEPGPQRLGTGGEMAMHESTDEGETWARTKMLTSNSERNHSYARRPVNAHDDFYSFWADGNADEFSASQLYFSNKKGEVFMLPYIMKEKFEKPVKLKSSK